MSCYRESGPQQVSRVPPWRPGMWVRLSKHAPEGLAGKVRRVKSLTASITTPDQRHSVWRVHFEDGRSVEWHLVERMATAEEIDAAARRRRDDEHCYQRT